MKLKSNEYIKIKDIDHLKRLCEENGLLWVDLDNELYKYNYCGLTFFTWDVWLLAWNSWYTEVFDEPQEKNMRYFVVFYTYENGDCWMSVLEWKKYVNIKQFQDSKIWKLCITNILELSQSDYEDFIR